MHKNWEILVIVAIKCKFRNLLMIEKSKNLIKVIITMITVQVIHYFLLNMIKKLLKELISHFKCSTLYYKLKSSLFQEILDSIDT